MLHLVPHIEVASKLNERGPSAQLMRPDAEHTGGVGCDSHKSKRHKVTQKGQHQRTRRWFVGEVRLRSQSNNGGNSSESYHHFAKQSRRAGFERG